MADKNTPEKTAPRDTATIVQLIKAHNMTIADKKTAIKGLKKELNASLKAVK